MRRAPYLETGEGMPGSAVLAQQTLPRPAIVYRRSSSYHEISPSLETMRAGGVSFARPFEVNLADYWDYVEAIGNEACLAAWTGSVPPLRRFSVFVTDRCDLRCSYCRLLTSARASLSPSWLTARLEEAREMGAVFFDVMGLGEPTLFDELPSLLRKATKRGMVVTVGTHGATANLRDAAWRDRLLAAGPLKLRVSLDGAAPLDHDRRRSRIPTWRETVRFLEHAVAARENGRLPVGVFVNRVVTANNAAGLLRDVQFYADLGVDDVHLIPVRFCADQYLSATQIERHNAAIAPEIADLARRARLPWLAANARPFGSEPDEIARAARGLYHRPDPAADCYVQKAQIVLDSTGLPFTCLWARRNGGGPVFGPDTRPAEDLPTLRRALLALSFTGLYPHVCRQHCTRRIAEANALVERHLRASVGAETAPTPREAASENEARDC